MNFSKAAIDNRNFIFKVQRNYCHVQQTTFLFEKHDQSSGPKGLQRLEPFLAAVGFVQSAGSGTKSAEAGKFHGCR